MREGYKKTEIGVTSVEWEVVKLGDICDVRDGTHDSPKYQKDGIPFITSKHLTNNGIDFSDVNYISNSDHINFSKRSLVENGDILFGMIGTIGKPLIVNYDFEFSIKNIALLKFKDNTKLNNLFTLNLLKSTIIDKQFNKLANGGVQSFIALGMIRSLKIPLPPLKEQKEIANILSTADKKIEAIDLQIQKAQTLKKGLLQNLLREGIGHSEFKDSELGRIPVEWEVVELATITTILLSNVDKKSKEDEQDVKLCNYMDVYNNQYITNDLVYMEATAKDNQIERFQLQINDVIITKDSETKDDIAIPSVVMETFENLLCGYHLAILRPKEKILYGVYLMKAIQHIPVHKHFEKLANGITRFGLTSSSINQALIPLPPLKEQKQIAQILSTADEKLELLRAKKEKYETLKKGLLQKLLSGEVRVGCCP